jgi:Na+/proline symporter
MNQNWRDLIGGICLVLALHLGFLLLILLLRSIVVGSNFLDMLFSWWFFGIGISQFCYLIPVMLVFRRRRRFEVVKGMTMGIVLTLLINSACFGIILVAVGDIRELIAIVLICICLSMLTLYAFNRRSEKERAP